jgi:[ribosomal protein S18]-alanine N-acetyltransferase
MRFNDDLHIRWMIRSDLKRVISIENWCFHHPWAEADFIRCLRLRNCIGMVADMGDKDRSDVVGYFIYEIHKNRLELLTMAVDPKHQGCGIGRSMIAKLSGKLSFERRNRIECNVSEWNNGGIAFMQRLGFEGIAVIYDHFDTGETAYRFRLRHKEESVRTIHAKGGEIKWQR